MEDPSCGSVIAQVPAGDVEDVDAAVRCARTAFEHRSWANMRPIDRAKLLETIARLIEEHADELALLESFDNGKPVAHARAVDLPATIDVFRYMAGWCGAQRRPHQSDFGRRAAVSQLHSARTCWRGRVHRAVELPVGDGGLEDRAGAGRRLHNGPEAVGSHAAVGFAAGGTGCWKPVCHRAC